MEAGYVRLQCNMMLNGKKLVVLAALLYAAASVPQDVFKWTDSNGLVHFGESVPAGVENYERVSITPAPAAPPAPEQAPVAPLERSVAAPAPQPPARSTPVAAPQPASAFSLEELDRFCEDARELAIAPLRTEAIEECKAAPRNDPAYCERFYSDFGDGGRTVSGTIRPRMFDDLPECFQARQERNSRGRR